ncbi:hypothetical protein NRF20_08500 [Streptomyces sp. R-74717]|uniref:hypothetical protein n=1 Tax=Streptomyces TaxID=1883 RepID=UPI0037B163C2
MALPLPDVEETRRRLKAGQDLVGSLTVGEWLDRWLAGKRIRNLVTIFNAAVDDKRLPKNPCTAHRTVKSPKLTRRKAKAWQRSTVSAVRAELPERERFAMDLGLGLGLRQGEAFGLAETEFDFDGETVHVRRQLRWDVKGRPCFCLPKGGKQREVSGRDRKAPVFESSRQDMFHVLRHTYACVQLEAGESIVSVSQWLGHSSAEITLENYAHFMPGAGQRELAAMDSWLVQDHG